LSASAGARRLRGGRALRDDVERLPELVLDGAGDASKKRPGMPANRFQSHFEELGVIGVPPPDAIREGDQVGIHPDAAGIEELLERDPVRAVRLVREELALDGARELS